MRKHKSNEDLIRFEGIVENSSDLIKSLNYSNEPNDIFLESTGYPALLEGIKIFQEKKQRTNEVIKEIFCEAFGYSTSSNEHEKAISKLQNEERLLGNFFFSNGEKDTLSFTVGEL